MDASKLVSEKKVELYKTSRGVFDSVLKEIRELSKKKPDATLSLHKVKLLNKILEDLLEILADEPQVKFLSVLDADILPQNSDALLQMVQFESALDEFYSRRRWTGTWPNKGRRAVWVTQANLDAYNEVKEFKW